VSIPLYNRRGEAMSDPELLVGRHRPFLSPDQPAPVGSYEPTEAWPDPPTPDHVFVGDPTRLYRWVCSCGQPVEGRCESMVRVAAHEHVEGPLWGEWE
jgi:hypothetical protein